jgi:hypothetical protein
MWLALSHHIALLVHGCHFYFWLSHAMAHASVTGCLKEWKLLIAAS